jgi:hypothetical protein
MSSKYPIRPDVHERFVALVARADARVREERQAVHGRLAMAPAWETRQRGRLGANGPRDQDIETA